MSCDGIGGKYNRSTAEINVTKGQLLGYVAKYNNPHVHFGINSDTSLSEQSWGIGAVGANLAAEGWYDPSEFLAEHTSFDSNSSSIEQIADEAFDAIERNYGQYFPTAARSQHYGEYYYREYPETNGYLLDWQGRLYFYLGDYTEQFVYLGNTADWI